MSSKFIQTMVFQILEFQQMLDNKPAPMNFNLYFVVDHQILIKYCQTETADQVVSKLLVKLLDPCFQKDQLKESKVMNFQKDRHLVTDHLKDLQFLKAYLVHQNQED